MKNWRHHDVSVTVLWPSAQNWLGFAWSHLEINFGGIKKQFHAHISCKGPLLERDEPFLPRRTGQSAQSVHRASLYWDNTSPVIQCSERRRLICWIRYYAFTMDRQTLGFRHRHMVPKQGLSSPGLGICCTHAWFTLVRSWRLKVLSQPEFFDSQVIFVLTTPGCESSKS